MSTTLLLHREAMALADRAFAAKVAGDPEAASRFFRAAFDLEAQAAESISSNLEAEPTRAVLFRSAATLAVQCGLVEAAAKLVGEGLAGHPQKSLVEELQSVIRSSETRRAAILDIPYLREFLEAKKWTVNHVFQLSSKEAQYSDPG